MNFGAIMFGAMLFGGAEVLFVEQSKLAAIQSECAQELEADPFFTNIPVLTQHIQNIESEVDQALGAVKGKNSKVGACVVVVTPTANVTAKMQNVFGPFFDDIILVFRVLENPVINTSSSGTGIPALAIAERLANRMHMFQPFSANGPLVAMTPTISLANDPMNLAYDVYIKGSAGLTNIPPQVETPEITVFDGIDLQWTFGSSPISGYAAVGVLDHVLASATSRTGADVTQLLRLLRIGDTLRISDGAGGTLTAAIEAISEVFAAEHYFDFSIGDLPAAISVDYTYLSSGDPDDAATHGRFTLDNGNSPSQLFSDISLLWINRFDIANVNQSAALASLVVGQAIALTSSATVLHFLITSIANNPDYFTLGVTPTTETGYPLDNGILTTLSSGALPSEDADVAIDLGAPAVLIECDTPGASIWFTNVPGVNPAPRNSFLYNAPLLIEAGDVLRARGYLSGFLASAIIQQQVT